MYYLCLDQQNKRYIINNFRATSLEDNPLSSPVERDLRIYLPPNYFDSENKRYPVIYYLHGYGGNKKMANYHRGGKGAWDI